MEDAAQGKSRAIQPEDALIWDSVLMSIWWIFRNIRTGCIFYQYRRWP
jgi:hypothetical protein